MLREQSSWGWCYALLFLCFSIGNPSLLHAGYINLAAANPHQLTTAMEDLVLGQLSTKASTPAASATETTTLEASSSVVMAPVATTSVAAALSQSTKTTAKVPTYKPPAELGISGYAYLDSNKNGKDDAGEWVLGGVWLELIPKANPAAAVYTQSKADGSYSFFSNGNGSPLTPGAYSIIEFTPPTFTPTKASTGTFLNLKGAKIPTTAGTTSGDVQTAWYGTINTANPRGFEEIDNIYLPDPADATKCPGWNQYYAYNPTTGASEWYAVTNYDFGDYKAITMPKTKRSYLLGGTTALETGYPNPFAVPEPSSLAMLAIGGLGIFGWTRHRRARNRLIAGS